MTTVFVTNQNGVLEERIYLFGGLSRDFFSSLVYIRAHTHYYEWVMSHPGSENLKRFGHAACEWNNKILVIGGARKFIKEYKKRECLDDGYIYNPYTNQWTMMKWKGVFYARRYHTACIVGKHLLIQGGIDSLEKYQGDVMALNIDTSKEKINAWFNPIIEGEGPGIIANHTSTTILSKDKYQGIYTKHIETGEETKILMEGIYVFGGRDEKGPKNDLFVLKVGQKPCIWQKPETKGEPPIARYGHTATYYEKKNLLVIFGGRNDHVSGDSEVNKSYLNDIYILELDKLTWVRWDQSERKGLFPEGRYTHSASVLGNSIVIFGGLGEGNYCKSEILAFELEPPSTPSQQRASPTIEECRNNEENDNLILPLLTQQCGNESDAIQDAMPIKLLKKFSTINKT